MRGGGRGLGRRFLVCSRNSVRLVEFGSGGIQVESLQYVKRLVVGDWFLKWNCFYIVSMSRLADFRTRWCVESGAVGAKLRLKGSTSVSMEDSLCEKRFMVLFLKLVWSSKRIRRLVFLSFSWYVFREEYLEWGFGVWSFGLWCHYQVPGAIFTVFADVCPEKKEGILGGEAGAWCLLRGSNRREDFSPIKKWRPLRDFSTTNLSCISNYLLKKWVNLWHFSHFYFFSGLMLFFTSSNEDLSNGT